jgi:hypothetical protein
MPKNSEKAVPGESKRDRFVRLAEGRVSNAIRSIRIIGKLGNKAQYEFDEGDIKKIVGALTKEIEAMRARMTERGSKDSVDFKL